ncbi:hypothetical protein [Thermomonospora umbrina]|uniref:Nephrocystin 3-like N-terminal domain-containing protein n=1 Tax=Thermomonospora umbrina TaxID=111806 RepID=A0A3D9SUX1_9ACTN|nr:hypothetical protein [Thermomonospora umbrina]REE96805.1 hypothetical protein DFJ69_2256 [Thermomonospora umbrina]
MTGRSWWGRVRRSGDAAGGDGAIVNTGIQNNFYGTPGPGPARSAYARQVEQIFSGELKDRRAELEELADFCTRSQGPAYAWWQAPAWAGKSALMASFVQNPPAGVRVVSFFITARLAGQSDRAAFLAALLEQLAELTGQALPDVLTESNRQQWFLQLLDEAASECAAAGCRLALVVDGLDEDRGVRRGADAHSIAALLPGRPPDGVRVVVSGRPNPPVPADVPDWHPLRDPAIIRPLRPSDRAVAFRAAAERELSDLLDGGGLGRDLLGLLVTAGGGLSGRDLAELTEEPVGEVERVLHGVTGRSFTGRDPQWTDGEGGELLVLAHEELVQGVLRSLRPAETRAWRERVHAWADHYRDAGWPQGTPEYLLRGYLQLLHKDGDLPRMRRLVTDRERLDRMLDVSKGDGAAMADLVTVQEYIRDRPDPDLSAALHVGLARQRLARRNSNLPPGLPAAWVLLGNVNRALALAGSITAPARRTTALCSVAEALMKIGQDERAVEVAVEAESVARSINEPYYRANVPREVVDALVTVREPARAESVARSITELDYQAVALCGVVPALVAAGRTERAAEVAAETEAVARSLADPHVLGKVAIAWAGAGRAERAAEVAVEAESIARAIPDPRSRADALSDVAIALSKAGRVERAAEVAVEAEAVARSVADAVNQGHALVEVVRALTRLGDSERAEVVARSVPDLHGRSSALREVVTALAAAGELERAVDVAAEAEAVGRSVPDTLDRPFVLRAVVPALVTVREPARAESVARSITDPRHRAAALGDLVRGLVEAGQVERAVEIAAEAEVVARTDADPHDRTDTLRPVVAALVEVGEVERAVDVIAEAESGVCSITHPGRRAYALEEVVNALVRVGDVERAEVVARSIADLQARASALCRVVHALVEAGSGERAVEVVAEAEAVARSIDGRYHRAHALVRVADALVKAGCGERAVEVVAEAEAVARSVEDPYLHDGALGGVANALAGVEELGRAEAIARSLEEPSARASALSHTANTLAKAGQVERATEVVAEAETLARSLDNPYSRSYALAEVVEALVGVGDLERAEAVARSIPHSPDRVGALSDVVNALVKAGRIERAEAITRSTVDSPMAAFTLRPVIDGIDPLRAKHLVASVLLNAPATALLPSVAMLSPDAVVEAIEYVRDLDR